MSVESDQCQVKSTVKIHGVALMPLPAVRGRPEVGRLIGAFKMSESSVW